MESFFQNPVTITKWNYPLFLLIPYYITKFALIFFIAQPKFVAIQQNHHFQSRLIYIGVVNNLTCIICVNCTVTGKSEPVVTWEYLTASMSKYMPVITNQSDASSSYFKQDNSQVSTIPSLNTFSNLLFFLI